MARRCLQKNKEMISLGLTLIFLLKDHSPLETQEYGNALFV